MFAESELVKKPNAKIQYTKEQIEQLIKCSHPETGPRYFIENFVYIQHPTKGRMLLHLYDFQKRLIDAFNGYVYSCHLISRQMGKCLKGDTKCKIRNKKTGEVMEITIEQLHEMVKNERDM